MPSITSLLTAEEMSEKLKGILSASRLEELAECKIIPHYVVDDTVWFGAAETKEWCQHNFMERCAGKQLGAIATIVNVVAPRLSSSEVPVELRAVANFLIPMELQSVEAHSMTGIYFLCSEGAVVYVGQSANVISRIGAHFGKKTFDFAFLMRIPKSDLDFVEEAFIKGLKPKYNWSSDGKRLISPNPWETKKPNDESLRVVTTFQYDQGELDGKNGKD